METALTNADLNESDIGSAPRLLEIIMQNCRGRVDGCIGHYIALALNKCAACPGSSSATSLSLDLTSATPFWLHVSHRIACALNVCDPILVLSIGQSLDRARFRQLGFRQAWCGLQPTMSSKSA